MRAVAPPPLFLANAFAPPSGNKKSLIEHLFVAIFFGLQAHNSHLSEKTEKKEKKRLFCGFASSLYYRLCKTYFNYLDNLEF